NVRYHLDAGGWSGSAAGEFDSADESRAVRARALLLEGPGAAGRRVVARDSGFQPPSFQQMGCQSSSAPGAVVQTAQDVGCGDRGCGRQDVLGTPGRVAGRGARGDECDPLYGLARRDWTVESHAHAADR